MNEYDRWAKERYKLFEEKIEAFKSHPRYEWLRKYADNAKRANEGYGYSMISGEDFIKRIEQATLNYIEDWLNEKNKLEWSDIRKINEKRI